MTVETGLSPAEFLDRHAAPGRVGLAGGETAIERAIRRGQRRLTPHGEHSRWSHAFLVGECRADGQMWVLESDLEVHGRHVRLGVQENRLSKYADAAAFPHLAVLDFGLEAEQTRAVLTEALDLLTASAHYSLRELAGTFLAIRRPRLRGRENLLARQGAFYCSAFVQHCYRKAGIDLAAGVSTKNTTPEDIASTAVPHRTYVLAARVT